MASDAFPCGRQYGMMPSNDLKHETLSVMLGGDREGFSQRDRIDCGAVVLFRIPASVSAVNSAFRPEVTTWQ